jgi:cytochrome c oxidase subunit III
MEIPYTVEIRPDTGLYNGKLGTWLFLASEVMLFGALFSAYALLRTGAADWPHGWSRLSVPLAAINTVLLLSSSVTIWMSWASLKRRNLARSRMYTAATVGLATIFLAVKLLEYRDHVGRGEVPSLDNFFATYFLLTGVHGVHVIGGVLVMLYLLGPGAGMWLREPQRYTNRVETTALYWHFVDLVWLCLFTTLYLL